MSRMSLRVSVRQDLRYGPGPAQRDEHVVVFLHVNVLVKRVLGFEGIEVDLWEILWRQFR